MVERMDMVVDGPNHPSALLGAESRPLFAWMRSAGRRTSDEVLGLIEEARGLRRATSHAEAPRGSGLQSAAEAGLRRVHADELAQLCQHLAWTELMRLSGRAGGRNGLERGSTEPPSTTRLEHLATTARRADPARIDLLAVALGRSRAGVAELCALEHSLRPGAAPRIHALGAAQLLGDWSASDGELEALHARTIDPRHAVACCHLLEAAARRRGDWRRGARWNWRAATLLPGRIEGWLLALRAACRAGDELMARQAARTLDEFGADAVRSALRGGWRRRDGDLARDEAAIAGRIRARIDERHGDWSKEAWIHG